MGNRQQEILMPGYAVGRVKVQYGWIEWVKTPRGFLLLLVVTLFLCLAMGNGKWHGEFHLDIDRSNNEPTVAVTVSPGLIALSAESLDNGTTVQAVSHSSVPIDAIVKARDMCDTYWGLMPGEFFNFKSEEPCTITAVASCEQGIDTND